jgi:hypothetical protein
VRKTLLLVPMAGLLMLGPIGAGSAQTSSSDIGVFRADLAPVGDNPAAHGAAFLTRRGDRLSTTLYAQGLSPNLPHAIHIHGLEQAEAECPGLGRDVDGNGLIDTLEGIPDYGPILVSFTTSGTTGGNLLPDGLDLSRFPNAGRTGFLFYSRTFTIPTEVADRLADHHIVVHGHDLNGNGVYDGELSSLTDVVGAPVPLEAELPVACGALRSLR